MTKNISLLEDPAPAAHTHLFTGCGYTKEPCRIETPLEKGWLLIAVAEGYYMALPGEVQEASVAEEVRHGSCPKIL